MMNKKKKIVLITIAAIACALGVQQAISRFGFNFGFGGGYGRHGRSYYRRGYGWGSPYYRPYYYNPYYYGDGAGIGLYFGG